LVSFVETPIDLLKIKLQVQVKRRVAERYTSVFDAVRKIVGTYGIRALYQGFAPTILRNTPAFGGYFCAFEGVKRWLTPANETPTLLTSFLAGGAGGFGFWGFIYPIELVKTRIQSDATALGERKYKGVIDCFNKTIKGEGVKGLFRGYVPAIVRAVPVNACVFLAVTATKRQLNQRQQQQQRQHKYEKK